MRSKAKPTALLVFLSVFSMFTCISHVQSSSRTDRAPPSPVSDPSTVPPIEPVVVHPQETEVPEPDMDIPTLRRLQLALSRICVSESGFQIRTNDCSLIYHTLRTRSRTGEITMGIMRAYSGRTFDRNRTDRHRWIPHLNHDFREPEGWRETVTIPWSTRRGRFIEVYNHVGSLLRRRPENTCGVRIDHWGARGFRRQLHLSNGWRLVQCGETLNDFWSIPENDDQPEEIEEVASL